MNTNIWIGSSQGRPGPMSDLRKSKFIAKSWNLFCLATLKLCWRSFHLVRSGRSTLISSIVTAIWNLGILLVSYCVLLLLFLFLVVFIEFLHNSTTIGLGKPRFQIAVTIELIRVERPDWTRWKLRQKSFGFCQAKKISWFSNKFAFSQVRRRARPPLGASHSVVSVFMLYWILI